MRWKRIIAGGIAPHAISIGLLVVVTVGYTFVLTFRTGGEPDQGSLQQFNVLFGTQLVPLLTILLTVVAAAWVVRRVGSDTITLHGFSVGLLVALIGLAFGAFDWITVVRFTSTVVAGILGAKLEPVLFSR